MPRLGKPVPSTPKKRTAKQSPKTRKKNSSKEGQKQMSDIPKEPSKNNCDKKKTGNDYLGKNPKGRRGGRM